MHLSNDQRATRRHHALVGALLAATVLAGGAAVWISTDATAAIAPTSNSSSAAQAGFADLAARIKPAVVNIATSVPGRQAEGHDSPFPPEAPFGELFRHYFGQDAGRAVHAQGSGFIIDPAGYIVTNHHVIDGANKITVTLDDGRSYPATLVGRDEKTDLALLKVEAGTSLPYVGFGDSDNERVGDWVVAVGNPFGLGGTVTAGIVSAHGRNINESPYDDFLQIDAPINPGNSGGPLFNQSGQVIGIDTAIYSPNGGSVGIGFAIPSNLASKVVAQLREHGRVERAWLGVQMQAITMPLAKAMGRASDAGVLVDQVEPNSPAAHAKLQQGDVIVAFNGTAINSPRDLALAVASAQIDQTSKLTVWREGKEQIVLVTLGAQDQEAIAAGAPATEGELIGMQLAPLSNDARAQLGLDSAVKGVVVADIVPDSRAEESGLRPGDVVTRVGRDQVATPAEAAAKIREAEKAKKESVTLVVLRDRAPLYLALSLAAG